VAAKDCVEAFLTHAIRPLMMLIQVSGHNRARQRDKWARLLEEFAALQDEVKQQLQLVTAATFADIIAHIPLGLLN